MMTPGARRTTMDMNDDFMGELEFDLTVEQSSIVNRAIELASQDGDAFHVINPLISVMQWWENNLPETERRCASPEQTLTEACRLYVLSKEKPGNG
jgi:hypothetical protein